MSGWLGAHMEAIPVVSTIHAQRFFDHGVEFFENRMRLGKVIRGVKKMRPFIALVTVHQRQ